MDWRGRTTSRWQKEREGQKKEPRELKRWNAGRWSGK
jgi:hypothetical protein